MNVKDAGRPKTFFFCNRKILFPAAHEARKATFRPSSEFNERTHDSFGFSAELALVSASAVSYSGVAVTTDNPGCTPAAANSSRVRASPQSSGAV